MKKIICCLFGILFLCGCSAKVDLLVTSNGDVTEKVSIWNNWKVFEQNGSSKEEVIDSYRNSYNSLFKNSNYTIEYISNEETIEANIEGNNNLKDISGSNLFQQLFKDLKIEKNENGKKYIFVYNDEVLSLFEDTLGIGGEEELFFDEIELNIQFHNVLSENTSDSYVNSTNTYTWLITKDNLNRNIEFVVTNEKRYDIIIPYLLKKYLGYIVLGLVIVAIIIFILLVLYKSKKENEI